MSLADDIGEEMDNLANARDSWRDRSLDVLSVALEEGASGGVVRICRDIIEALREERVAAPALPQPSRISVAVFERVDQQAGPAIPVMPAMPAMLPALESAPDIGTLPEPADEPAESLHVAAPVDNVAETPPHGP